MSGSPDKHYLQVSKATEFETIKKLPKFEHATGAVINPIHSESISRSPSREPRIKLVGSPVRYNIQETVTRILPEHLIRPPPDVFYESIMKERSIEDVIRIKELKENRKLSTKEKRELAEKEKKREETRKKLETVRVNSKLFFKECQLKLEEINLKDDKPSSKAKESTVKSVIGELFSVSLKGVRKLYNELMGSKLEKLTKHKFLEFAKKVTGGDKLTDTVLKDLFNFYCKKNKKQGGKAKANKVSLNL
jgi:hypothetical protein